tara:strand:+ start:169 stop:765 length:597 start_codon:yes stop_codon:yes gene_type:complete
MNKIKKVLIGTNNEGKYKEIFDLLPNDIEKLSPKEFKIKSPKEIGKTYEENSLIKASYFSNKTNLVCISDDSGLEIDALKGKPGIYSSRWAGKNKDFDFAIKRILMEIKKLKKNWEESNKAKFVCCMTICFPNGENYFSRGEIEGKICSKKKGKNGFGYDPIFIPNGYDQTFGEMESKIKLSIDHRSIAYGKINKFFI